MVCIICWFARGANTHSSQGRDEWGTQCVGHPPVDGEGDGAVSGLELFQNFVRIVDEGGEGLGVGGDFGHGWPPLVGCNSVLVVDCR
jgi:hypothetical protein